jgi:hypothetical protein
LDEKECLGCWFLLSPLGQTHQLNPIIFTGFETRLTRRVPLVEQELLTLPVFSGVRVTRFLVFYIIYSWDINVCGDCSLIKSQIEKPCKIFILHRVLKLNQWKWGSCYSIFSFLCLFCRSLFVLLYFFFWPLYCLFFDIWILITILVSSNSSCDKFSRKS